MLKFHQHFVDGGGGGGVQDPKIMLTAFVNGPEQESPGPDIGFWTTRCNKMSSMIGMQARRLKTEIHTDVA